jgi:uncharacterized protein YktB (UPF0637 family)
MIIKEPKMQIGVQEAKILVSLTMINKKKVESSDGNHIHPSYQFLPFVAYRF